MKKFAIAIHGGAGTINRNVMSAEMELLYKQALEAALVSGENVLKVGGHALDAVEAAVVSMEDNPLFNAGKGSVFTHEGKHEMDAAIMNGQNLMAGAIAGATGIKNPISMARMVMEKTDHVLLCGPGLIEFAKKNKIEILPEDYFFVQLRFDQLQEARKSDKVMLDHNAPEGKKFGTVGAVAIDTHGNLAAGTSTGGMTNKKNGRIGDTPLIGSGTYANNKTCAISCTGHGEFFIRSVVAYDISCLIEYKNCSLKEACDIVVHQKLVKIGGEGGLIAIDKFGNIELPFNSEGMYRASLVEGDKKFIGIYKDEN